MSSVVLVGRLVLAAVFLTAGIAKLLDLPGSRRALVQFGVPERVAAVGGPLLPLAEIAVAAVLLPVASATAGAVAALLLLLVFVGGIGSALASGRQPDCHCFGQLHSAPAGPSTLARNGVLAGLAIVVLAAGPGPSIGGWVDSRSAAELLAWGFGLATAALAALSLNLWLENRRLRSGSPASSRRTTQAVELEVGEPAPMFTLPLLDGAPMSLGGLCGRGRPVLLAFVDPDCGPCHALLPELGRWQEILRDRLTIAVVSGGDASANQTLAEEHDVVDFMLQRDTEVREAFGALATPSAVLVSQDGVVASELAKGSAAIESLIRHQLARIPAAA